MATEIIRIKVEDQNTNPLAKTLIRIFDEDFILQAQGLTSEGPDPAKGVFETILVSDPSPGKLYTIDMFRPHTTFSGRAQIRVRTGG